MIAILLPVIAVAVVFSPGKLEVVVAPEACSTVQFAAEEAQAFLAQSLGAEVPLVNVPTGGRASLVVGPNRWADAAGVTTNGLKRDGFRIRTAGERVFIVGIDDSKADIRKAFRKGGIWLQNFEKATLFGVYDFLERFAGVRFYFPGELGTVVPRAARIVVPDTDFTDAPVYTHRHYTIYDGGEYFEGEDRRELRHPGRTICWWRNRMQTEYVPCCHGQNKFKYMERFAKSHPEYFALLPDGRRHNSPKITSPGHPGQICHSSAIWDEIYADAKSYLLGEPASVRGIPVDSTLPNAPKRYGWGSNCQAGKYVDVMPQDGMIKCSCEACQAYYRGVEDRISWASELIWGRVAECGRRLKAAGVPGYITNLAYSKYRHVPKVEIPDNVLVMVAERGPWTDRDPEERAREIAEIKAWNAKIGKKVWMWTYSGKFAKLNERGIPPITPKAIGRYYAMLAPWITGGYEELDSERFIHNYLNQYVLGKVMWDPSVDVEAIVDEHHRLMFGAAAPEMKRFFDAVEDVWLGQVAGKTLDTPLGPQSLSPSKRELFTTVYSPALLAEWDGLFAAAAKKVPEGSLEARRIALMKREILDWLEDAVNEFHAKCAKADACRVKGGRAAAPILLDRVVSRAASRVPAPVRTEVRVWEDEDAYHFVYDCEEPAMDDVSCAVRKPDDPRTWEDNGVELFLNPSGDRLTRYQFMLASSGAFADLRNGDVTWNSGAAAKAVRTAAGWRATIDIPRKVFPEAKSGGFPMNFSRDRVTKNGCTFITWGVPDTKDYGDIDNYGIVEF